MKRIIVLKPLHVMLGLCAAAILLAGCQSGDAPAKGIERYLEAVIAKDADRAITASCAAWEESAQQEVDSFKAVEATLDNLSCATSGDDGASKLVACTGKIKVSYNAESREVDLAGKVYVAAQEGGDWRMCGYK